MKRCKRERHAKRMQWPSHFAVASRPGPLYLDSGMVETTVEGRDALSTF